MCGRRGGVMSAVAAVTNNPDHSAWMRLWVAIGHDVQPPRAVAPCWSREPPPCTERRLQQALAPTPALMSHQLVCVSHLGIRKVFWALVASSQRTKERSTVASNVSANPHLLRVSKKLTEKLNSFVPWSTVQTQRDMLGTRGRGRKSKKIHPSHTQIFAL